MRRYALHLPTFIVKAAFLLLLAGMLLGCSEDTANRPAPTIIPVAPSRAFPTATKPMPPTPVPPTPTKVIFVPPTPTPMQAMQGLARLTILYTNDTGGYVDPCG
ncbi:MAG: hypothetical protein ACUVR2_11155 [Anaerolineae bacterium]